MATPQTEETQIRAAMTSVVKGVAPTGRSTGKGVMSGERRGKVKTSTRRAEVHERYAPAKEVNAGHNQKEKKILGTGWARKPALTWPEGKGSHANWRTAFAHWNAWPYAGVEGGRGRN